MSLRKATFPILAALVVTATAQAPAWAQREGTSAQQADNARAAIDLRTRIAATDARITAAQRSGRITRARATALHRQVARTQTSMTRLSRHQSFVSAAEFASYERSLGTIDIELDRRGVERSYGNDVLPSAETIAFQQANARLGYRNARIEHDARGCAIYRGTARDGRLKNEPLLSSDGQPICMRR